MQSETLKAAMEAAKQLPVDEQERLAVLLDLLLRTHATALQDIHEQLQLVFDALDEAEWSKRFADPQSEAIFDRWAEQAVVGPFNPMPDRSYRIRWDNSPDDHGYVLLPVEENEQAHESGQTPPRDLSSASSEADPPSGSAANRGGNASRDR